VFVGLSVCPVRVHSQVKRSKVEVVMRYMMGDAPYLSLAAEYVHIDSTSEFFLGFNYAAFLPGNLALAGWAGWSAGQVGRHVKC